MEVILQWIRSVVIYVILISAVMYLLPDNQYRKYVQLFAGLLLILIVMEPVANILAGEDLMGQLYEKALVWQTEYESSEMLEQIGAAGDSVFLDTYEKQLKEQLASQLQEEEVEVEEIEIELSENGIETIYAELSTSGDMTLSERNEKKERLVRQLSEFYEISADSIEICIRN